MTDRNRSRPKLDPLPEYVAASKGSSSYQAHTYPTKVPPQAIVPFIEASTDEGGIVADPFSGSGMTGVAALLAGRSAMLSDLSPGAAHLSRNHTRWVDPQCLLRATADFDRRWMRRVERDLYAASLAHEGISGLTRHTIWSEAYPCPTCRARVVLWDVADPEFPLPRAVTCPGCQQAFDRTTVHPAASLPVHVVLEPDGGGKLVAGAPSAQTLDRMQRLTQRRVRHWVPNTPVESHREMYIRSALHLRGIRTVADFFAPRPKLALSRLYDEIRRVESAAVREALEFAFTNTAWHSSRMRRYNAKGGQRPLTGTLFIPQLVSEPNVFEVFRHQVRQIARYYSHLPHTDGAVEVRCGSATDLSWLPDHSVDYVFTDPPFGSNLFYADCNIVWEAWLGEVTENDAEIVVNKSRHVNQGGKTVHDYQRLLTHAFMETRRIVRPGGRVSIVFHNSDDAVWSALLDAVEAAGLHQAEVSILDKGQRSQKGYKIRRGELVPFYDLVMTFTESKNVAPRLNGAGEIAVAAVTDHLSRLNASDAPAKRGMDYLYSIAVSSIIQAGAKPNGLSLRAFQALWREHFATRD
jgi:16S rRNA G966 N2-methylase RsmD